MSTATYGSIWHRFARPRSKVATGPERKPRPGPIFINDAVVPWKQGTMLLEILRADTPEDDDPPSER